MRDASLTALMMMMMMMMMAMAMCSQANVQPLPILLHQPVVESQIILTESQLIGKWIGDAGTVWVFKADGSAQNSSIGPRSWRTDREMGFCDKIKDSGDPWSCRLYVAITALNGSTTLTLDGETFIQ